MNGNEFLGYAGFGMILGMIMGEAAIALLEKSGWPKIQSSLFGYAVAYSGAAVPAILLFLGWAKSGFRRDVISLRASDHIINPVFAGVLAPLVLAVCALILPMRTP